MLRLKRIIMEAVEGEPFEFQFNNSSIARDVRNAENAVGAGSGNKSIWVKLFSRTPGRARKDSSVEWNDEVIVSPEEDLQSAIRKLNPQSGDRLVVSVSQFDHNEISKQHAQWSKDQENEWPPDSQ